MGVTPQYVGKYGKPWTINLNTDSGADNLTGVSVNQISVVVRDLGTGNETTSAGAITIVTSNPAQITWQPTATDYGSAGSYEARVEITFGTGPIQYDPIPFEVKAT